MRLIILFRQDRLQRGYIALTQTLPWLHEKLSEFDIDDSKDMLKKVCAVNFKAFRTNPNNVIAQKGCRCGPR
jgi:hypothetical protein